MRTLVLDEIRVWPSADGSPLRFAPNEPFSNYEVSVWGGDGRLVAHAEHSVARGFDIEMRISDPSRNVNTPWDRRLSPNLQRLVEEATAWTPEYVTPRDYRDDPWVPVADRKRTLLQGLTLGTGRSEFFDANPDEHVRAVLFLAKLLRRKDVSRAVLADPYLDKSGVESLLVRVPDVRELIALVSHGRSAPEDPVSALIDACEKHRGHLPAKIRFLNVENANGEGQQFHDRCLIIETASGVEAWALTNSLSMVARRYPLIITRLDETATRHLANYLAALERGIVPGRPELKTVVLWNKTAVAAAAPVGQTQPSAPPFGREWQRAVLGILVPEAPLQDRLMRALNRQLLEREVVPTDTTWRVPVTGQQLVSGAVRNHIQNGNSDPADIHQALAMWAYNGGPDATAYRFGPEAIDPILVALERCLAPMPVGTNPILDVQMPETLDEIHIYRAYNCPADMIGGSAPAIDFHAGILWSLSPARLVELLDRTRSLELFNWLAAHGHRLTPDQRQAILRSALGRVRALGVAILWDDCFDRNSSARNDAAFALEQSLDEINLELGRAGVAPIDTFLCQAYLATTNTRQVPELDQAASLVMRYYAGELGDVNRARLIGLLEKPHPLHTIVRVSALAGAFPALGEPELDRWCFNELLRHLPRRGHPTPPLDGNAALCTNRTLTDAIGRSAWRLFDISAPEEIVRQIIDMLDYFGANAPLYPTRDFAGWSDHLDGVLWGLQFALRFVEAAPAARRAGALQAVLPAVLTRLGTLRPGLWHRYLDSHGLLAELLDIRFEPPAILARLRVVLPAFAFDGVLRVAQSSFQFIADVGIAHDPGHLSFAALRFGCEAELHQLQVFGRRRELRQTLELRQPKDIRRLPTLQVGDLLGDLRRGFHRRFERGRPIAERRDLVVDALRKRGGSI